MATDDLADPVDRRRDHPVRAISVDVRVGESHAGRRLCRTCRVGSCAARWRGGGLLVGAGLLVGVDLPSLFARLRLLGALGMVGMVEMLGHVPLCPSG